MLRTSGSLLVAGLTLLHAQAATYYVDASRANDTGGGTSWATAKRTLQAAVDLAVASDTVLVTNGVYNTGTTVTPGCALMNRVVVAKAITVRSVNGPTVTVIEGSGTNSFDAVSAVRCVYLSNGVLEGFTLRHGATYGYDLGSEECDLVGGGVNMLGAVSGTTVTNCVIQNCRASGGGGSAYGTLLNCTLATNTAEYGGGSYDGALNRCTLSANAATTGGGCYNSTLNGCTLAGNRAELDGGGAYDGTLNNCSLTGNVADYGAGSSGGTLNNCLLAANSASASGGGCYYGTLNNCTLWGNAAATSAGGSYRSAVRNGIVWGNAGPNGAVDNHAASTFAYSCTTPLPSGAGNIATDPQFAGAQDLRLWAGSPCLDAGSNAHATLPTDLLGNQRIQNGTVDMGAYEGGLQAAAPPAFDPPTGTRFVGSLAVAITCATAGASIRYTLDGSEPTDTSALYTQSIAVTAATTVAARAFKPGLASNGSRADYWPAVYFVDASRPDDSGAATDWATAKRTIQAAVDVAIPNGTVLVTNGVYNTGTSVTPGYALMNRVVITNAITVRSINGPEATVIEGSGTNHYDTTSAVRCVYMGAGVLDGFTLRGGTTYGWSLSGSDDYDRSGGGVNLKGAAAGATVTNCVIQGCLACDSGGGSYFGTLSGCTLAGNRAGHGGGASRGTLNGCTLTGNRAYFGGGSNYGTLNGCTLTGNAADYGGGGSAEGTLNRCVLSGNTAPNGGGSHYGTLNNCTLTGNTASVGGGSYNGTLLNCTVAGNTADLAGGSSGGTLLNGIVWGNARPNGTTDNYASSAFYNSCTTPLPTGIGNVAAAPQFVDANDLRLREGSPCLDTGNNAYVTLATDVLGNPRVQNGTVDMGAYEGGVAATAQPVFDPPSGAGYRSPLTVTITCATAGATVRYTLDGREPTEADALYTGPIRLCISATVAARAFKPGLVPSGVRATYSLNVYLVDASRPDDSGDGRSWATAKKTIQAAVNLAADNDTVLVTNGVYSTGTTATPGYALLNRVVVTNAIAVRSVNGPEATVIEGSGTNVYGTSSAVRCVYLGKGVLQGFTLRGGATYGFSLPGHNDYDQSGGGVNLQGAATGTAVTNCIIRDCRAYRGGGSCGGTLNGCVLVGNTATSGGGAYSTTLNNCTLSGNTATSSGGGAHSSTLRNCIVWGNASPNGTVDNHVASLFTYSCTMSLPSGTGNIATEPQFVSAQDLRLRSTSPCLDAGDNAYAPLPTDLLGNPRIQNGKVDMGAYEGGVPAASVPVFDPPDGTRFVGSLAVAITCATDGASIRYTLDGSEPTEGSALYTGPLNLTAAKTVAARAFKPGLLSSGARATYRPAVLVDASRPNDSGDGLSWATAKKTIQSAVDIAGADGTVVVTNGLYNTGTAVTPGYRVRNRVVVTNSVTVRSVNGPAATIIEGSGTNFYNTSSAVRCVYMRNGVLDGFTLRGGTTDAGPDGDQFFDNSGGGVNLCGASAGTSVTNCVIRDNIASYGGGSYGGTLRNCTLTGNGAANGGGAYQSTLSHCALLANTAQWDGGGSYASTLTDCTLTGNTAEWGNGGGTYQSTLSNCALLANTVLNDWGSFSYNNGGGSYGGTLDNCTLWGNTATKGGGTYYSTLRNCIVWGNAHPGGATNNYEYSTFSSSCTTPLPSDTGNIDADPQFVGAADLRLREGSPCIDAGSNGYAPMPTDLLGNVRIQNGTVDMGAYEGGVRLATTTTPVPVPHAWLDQYPDLLALAGGDYEAAALADVDGDGHAAWQELVTGSVPTNRESVLRTHLALSNGVPWVTWTPDLGAARAYAVEGRTNLTEAAWGPTNAASRFFRTNVRLP